MVELNLCGLKIDSIVLAELIGQGSFGQVYRGVDALGNSCAVKVALKNESLQLTEALAIYSGSYGKVHPLPEKLLEVQYKRVSAAPGLFPLTESPQYAGNYSYLKMNLVNGMTLRAFLAKGLEITGKLQLAIRLYACFEQIVKSKLKYHGDLKPENIMVTDKEIILLDPGYFGSMSCTEGLIPSVVISSPLYYPRLEPDDTFAAGSILWEMFAAKPVLCVSESTEDDRVLVAAESLQSEIAYQEMLGRYFLSPLRSLAIPAEVSQLPIELQDILLASLGLILKDETLSLDKEQASFASILSRLQACQLSS